VAAAAASSAITGVETGKAAMSGFIEFMEAWNRTGASMLPWVRLYTQRKRIDQQGIKTSRLSTGHDAPGVSKSPGSSHSM
jgi:hypothetical protein